MSSLPKHPNLSYLLPIPLGMLLPLQYKLWASLTSDFPVGAFPGVIIPIIFMVLCFADFADSSAKYRKDPDLFEGIVAKTWIACSLAQIIPLLISIAFGIEKEIEGDIRTVSVIILTVCGFAYSASKGTGRGLVDLFLGTFIAMSVGWMISVWIVMFSIDPVSTKAAFLIGSFGSIPGYVIAYYIHKEH